MRVMGPPLSRSRRRLRRIVLAGAAALSLVAVATGLAASQAPPRDARALGELFFGPSMARAEVVLVVRGEVRDYRIDQGRIMAVRPEGLDLLERDGTRLLVPVAPTAQVVVNGRPASLLDLARGMSVITIRDGDHPAETVRATGGGRPGKGPGKTPGKP